MTRAIGGILKKLSMASTLEGHLVSTNQPTETGDNQSGLSMGSNNFYFIFAYFAESSQSPLYILVYRRENTVDNAIL